MRHMSIVHVCPCGNIVSATRWRKGKHFCVDCGLNFGAKVVTLQGLWNRLPLETQTDLLRPYFVDSPEWSMVEPSDPTIKGE